MKLWENWLWHRKVYKHLLFKSPFGANIDILHIKIKNNNDTAHFTVFNNFTFLQMLQRSEDFCNIWNKGNTTEKTQLCFLC